MYYSISFNQEVDPGFQKGIPSQIFFLKKAMYAALLTISTGVFCYFQMDGIWSRWTVFAINEWITKLWNCKFKVRHFSNAWRFDKAWQSILNHFNNKKTYQSPQIFCSSKIMEWMHKIIWLLLTYWTKRKKSYVWSLNLLILN